MAGAACPRGGVTRGRACVGVRVDGRNLLRAASLPKARKQPSGITITLVSPSVKRPVGAYD